MFVRFTRYIAVFALAACAQAEDWPQAGGKSGDFQTQQAAPTEWSVTRGESIAWRISLPETGQSTPVICDGRVFFTTYQEVEKDAELGKDIVAWCCSAASGEVLWQRKISGRHLLRISGCFSDSTSPPAVCDAAGRRVVFINASGTVECFDFDGETLWKKEILSVGRTLPFFHTGNIVFIRQIYPPDADGNFPHSYAESPLEMWTQMQALDLETGEVAWTSSCGVNMGCAILPQERSDGRAIAVVGRGGGHGPPEKPDGISMIDLQDGSTLWSLPIEDFMATMSYQLRNDQVHLFHGGEHLSVDAFSGEIVSRVKIVGDISVRRMIDGERVTVNETLELGKSETRMITQTSNLLIGRYHYFRSYTKPWIGRVNVDSGALEYLELPLQLSRIESSEDEWLWYKEPQSKADAKLEAQTLVPNDMKNSRGYVVIGDSRSRGNGWGHIASPIPSVAGDHLYVPVMTGTVYVIRWDADVLDENAVVAINDLGVAGKTWTRGSLSFANGKVFAHTIRELICIGE